MKYRVNRVGIATILLCLVALFGAAGRSAAAKPWVDLYYPGWQESANNPGVNDIDLRACTHLIYFGFAPTVDGGVDDSGLVGAAKKVSAAAHAAGKKALVCLGGESTRDAFVGALQASVMPTFVKNLTHWVIANNYDGIDVDMEPMQASDIPSYIAFIRALHDSLKKADPNLMLTAVPGADTDPRFFAPVIDDLDQVNVQTYEMSGPWGGFLTWHNGPIHTAGNTFPGGFPAPSTDISIANFEKAGIPAAKLGIGVDCWGKDWHGATKPMAGIDGVNVTDVSFRDIITKTYSPSAYHYDSAAGAAWLGLPHDFISYDDPRMVRDKMAYVRKTGLGGIILWDIGGEYFPNQNPSQPLSDSVYAALNPTTAAPTSPTAVTATGGYKQVALTWNGAAGSFSYNVYRGSASGQEDRAPIAASVAVATYTDTSVTNGITYFYTVVAVNDNGTSASSKEASAVPATPVEAAYGGKPRPIPGFIAFADYDTGGEGFAYHDSDPFNDGGQYRNDGVDIEKSTDTVGDGYDVAYTVTGEWMKYTVDVAVAERYNVTFRVAADGDGGAFHLAGADGKALTKVIKSPNTHGWQKWEAVTTKVTLRAGKQIIELYEDAGGMNLNGMEFTAAGG